MQAALAADPRWLAAAIALLVPDRALMAVRWFDLVRAIAGRPVPIRVLLRAFFASAFVSNFVPSVASDVYRAYELSRSGVRLADSVASVLMDRALGVLSVALVAS